LQIFSIMKMTLSEHDFLEACGKFTSRNNFSYYGKIALFEMLTEFEESTGQEIEFDFIAFCCEFTEYANLREIKQDYPNIKTFEQLENETLVYRFNYCGNKGILIQNF